MEKTQTQDIFVKVGHRVGDRYELVEHLGTGGFAKVFRAYDESIERDVAIKFLDLRGIHGDEKMVNTVLERFRREAKLAARIKHRNVVQIYDIGQVGDAIERPYIVMELLHGFDLEDQLVGRGPMPPEQILGLFVDALDALGEAHELGIVHKDLKPSNLFLSDPETRSEALRIVDFGIAHLQTAGEHEEEDETPQASGRLTATGQILGTLQYLTPEYINAQVVTPALDVYQMALILVELLSGHRVIDTDNAFECLRIHTFGLLELPDYLLESPLGPVLRRALHSEYTERIPDAKSFADELSAIDASSVPPSPLLAEGKVTTSQFLNTQSHPALPSRNTSQAIQAPSTAQLSQEAVNLMDDEALADTAGYDLGAIDPSMEVSAEERLTAVSAIGERERQTSAELPPVVTPMNETRGLKVLLTMIVVLILFGVGVVMLLAGPEEQVPAVSTKAPPVEVDVPKAPPEAPVKTPPESVEVVKTPPEVAEPEPKVDPVPPVDLAAKAPVKKVRKKKVPKRRRDVEKPPQGSLEAPIRALTPKPGVVKTTPPIKKIKPPKNPKFTDPPKTPAKPKVEKDNGYATPN